MATSKGQSSSGSNDGHLNDSSQQSGTATFPESLYRTLELPHALAAYAKRWNENPKKKFEPSKKWPIYFGQLTAGQNGAYTYGKNETIDLAQLEAYYKSKPSHEAAQSYIHIGSKSSRSPLACSREEIDLILTDHQVMAAFVDLLSTFRKREQPHFLATFKVEDHLEHTFQRQAHEPINRSGIRTQHCFNVLGIEKSEGEWMPRQVAAYHSFDVLEARATWIIVKGDGAIRKRLDLAAESIVSNKPKILQSASQSFGQTLRDHLLILQWCAEGWSEYLETMEENCRKATVMTRFSDIPALVEDAPKWWEQQRVEDFASQNTTSTPPNRLQRAASMVSGKPNTPALMVPPRRKETFKRSSQKLSKMDVLENLRDLRQYSVEMQDMMSRLEQSARVVEGIMTRYHSLVRSRRFTQHLQKEQKREYREQTDDFETQLRLILGSLEGFQARMRTIHDCRMHEGDVFNHILQACSMSTAEYYATSSRESTDAMQNMTEHMHHKTVSMHVITIFTLIFLPGTFVATIFSSGILTFGDDGGIGFGDQMGDWKVRVAGVKLFFAICLPLLIITLGAWLAVYWLARREGHGEERNQGQVDLEKASQAKQANLNGSGTSSPGGAVAPAAGSPPVNPAV